MSDTAIIEAPGGQIKTESTVFGVSVRAVLALVLVLTVCITHLAVCFAAINHGIVTKDLDLIGTLTTIGEPLYSLALLAVGFYFGASSKNPNKI